MKVSVVIPTLNGGELFKESLKRILSQELPDPFEVLCVDSGSNDGTPEFARAEGVRVMRIEKEDFNHGLTRNVGIAHTEGAFVALVVQDAIPVDAHWLASLTAALEADEKAAGSYSKQLPRDDCDPIIHDRLMNWSACRPDRIIQELGPEKKFEELEPMERLALISFDNVSSCIRRSVWEQIPFPPRNFGEDMAWTCQIIQKGFRIVFEPASQVVHSHNNGIWYEFKRIYTDHQNLNELVGLRTVPRFMQIFPNGSGAFRHYKGLIRKAMDPGPDRLLKTIRAFFYAYLENLAQYMGPRLNRPGRRNAPLARSLDNWLKKGV